MKRSHRLESVLLPQMGFGSAPISGLYRDIPEAVAVETVRFALEKGVTLLDTAPLYGLGLAEERIGVALSGIPRADFILSTKVGRVLHQDRSGFLFDYSYEGIMRSLEGSLARLKLDTVDILHIHDSDPSHPVEDALTQAFPTLLKLREEGVIKAIGAGMNEWEALDKLVRQGYDFDLFLLAGRYTLLEQGALEFLNLCHEKSIGILAAGVYNTGILATGAKAGAKYNYASVLPEILTHAQAIETICTKYNIPLNVAALQFVAAHPAVNTLVIGAESPAEIRDNLSALDVAIPDAFWAELLDNSLLGSQVPVSQAR